MRTMILVALAMFAMAAQAQTNGASFVAISVSDADQAAKWYTDNLGFKEIRRSEAPNKMSRAVILDSRYGMLEIVQHKEAIPLAKVLPDPKGAYQVHGIFKFGFFVDHIDDLYTALKQKKDLQFIGGLYTDEPLNLKSFIIRDNNGILVQFLERLPAVKKP